ncbi:MAG: HD domain-containing protein [Patescibacteria group bacterium]|nr:HD domain-containing protein [Patescibacteria group bacterium]
MELVSNSPPIMDLPVAVPDLLPQLTEFARNGDTATLEHSIRVSFLAVMAAEFEGRSAVVKSQASVAGLAHDLGKQRPEIAEVVHNGRPLTHNERRLINQHAQIGFEMLYETGDAEQIGVRERLGSFMGQVALDTLFSHANAQNIHHRGINQGYLADLVHDGVITPTDAESHNRQISVQLVTIADVSDAFLSQGCERSYRAARLAQEGCRTTVTPETMPQLVAATVQVPDLNIARIVPEFIRYYPTVTRIATWLAGAIAEK